MRLGGRGLILGTREWYGAWDGFRLGEFGVFGMDDHKVK